MQEAPPVNSLISQGPVYDRESFLKGFNVYIEQIERDSLRYGFQQLFELVIRFFLYINTVTNKRAYYRSRNKTIQLRSPVYVEELHGLTKINPFKTSNEFFITPQSGIAPFVQVIREMFQTIDVKMTVDQQAQLRQFFGKNSYQQISLSNFKILQRKQLPKSTYRSLKAILDKTDQFLPYFVRPPRRNYVDVLGNILPGYNGHFMWQIYNWSLLQQRQHQRRQNNKNWKFSFLIPGAAQHHYQMDYWQAQQNAQQPLPSIHYYQRINRQDQLIRTIQYRTKRGSLIVNTDNQSGITSAICGTQQLRQIRKILYMYWLYLFWGHKIFLANRDYYTRSHINTIREELANLPIRFYFVYRENRSGTVRPQSKQFVFHLKFTTPIIAVSQVRMNRVELQLWIKNRSVQIWNGLNQKLVQSRNHLQNYGQQQQQLILPYQFMCVQTRAYPVTAWGDIPKQLRATKIFYFPTTEQFHDTLLPARWQFWSKNLLDPFQYVQPKTRQCVIALRQKFPSFPDLQIPGLNKLLSVVQWCRATNTYYYIVGYPQFSPRWQQYYVSQKGNKLRKKQVQGLLIAPGHLEYTMIKNPHPRAFNSNQIFKYKSLHQRIECYQVKNPYLPQVKFPNYFQIGADLPVAALNASDKQKQLKWKNLRQLRFNTISVDIQCLALKEQRQIPYMICGVGYLSYDLQPTYFAFSNIESEVIYKGQIKTKETGYAIEDQVCLYKFCRWLSRIQHKYTKQDPLYIWGFNFMGYEIVYLTQRIVQVFGKITHVGPLAQCKSFSICEQSILFLDISKIVNGSLASLSRSFQLPLKKQEFNIKITEFQQVTLQHDRIKEYCYFDCISTYLLVQQVHNTLISIAQQLKCTLFPKQVKRFATASRIGWWFFGNCFMKQSIYLQSQKDLLSPGLINNQPFQVYQKQRESYYGGLVQVFKHISKQPVYVLDLNSQYPYIMTLPLPWIFKGTSQITNLRQVLEEKESDLYLFEVTFYQLPGDYKGSLIATKDEKGKNCYFNSYQGKPIYVRGITVKTLLKRKGRINSKVVHRYSSGNITVLKQFAETFYAMRVQKGKSNPAMKQCLKLLMNSLTGRLSMTQKSSYQSSIFPQLDNYLKISQNLYQCQGQASLPPNGRLVRLTAFITQRARVMLEDLCFRASFNNVIYCDTDSIITNFQGYQRLGSPASTATGLGHFKCQMVAKQIYVLNRKCYIIKKKDDTLLMKMKGFPKRFLTDQLGYSLISQFQQKVPSCMQVPYGTIVKLDFNVKMQVWRKKFNLQGIVINEMNKRVNIIVDRFMVSPYQTGYPRNPVKFLSFRQLCPIQCQEEEEEQQRYM